MADPILRQRVAPRQVDARKLVENEIRELGWPEGELVEEPLFDTRTCRVCGCTDEDACEGGCEWVEDDLCSRCAEV